MIVGANSYNSKLPALVKLLLKFKLNKVYLSSFLVST